MMRNATFLSRGRSCAAASIRYRRPVGTQVGGDSDKAMTGESPAQFANPVQGVSCLLCGGGRMIEQGVQPLGKA
jgi:hypothetical protein